MVNNNHYENHSSSDDEADEDWEVEDEIQMTVVPSTNGGEDDNDDGDDDDDDNVPVIITNSSVAVNDSDDEDDGSSDDEDWNPQFSSSPAPITDLAATDSPSKTTTVTTATTASTAVIRSGSIIGNNSNSGNNVRVIRSRGKSTAVHRKSVISANTPPPTSSTQQQQQQSPSSESSSPSSSTSHRDEESEKQSQATLSPPSTSTSLQRQSSRDEDMWNSMTGTSSSHKYSIRLDSDRKSKFSEATTTVQQMTQEFTQATKYSGYLDKKNPYGIGKKRRWFTIEDGNIFYFDKKEASRSLGKICLKEVRDIVSAPKSRTSFVIQTVSRDYILMAENATLCEEWMANIRLAMSPYSQHAANEKKAARAENSTTSSFNLCGKLKKLGPSGGWRKRYFEYTPEEHTLSYKAKQSKSALGYIHLDKALSVEKGVSTKISKKSSHKCIQIFTPGRNFILKAEDDQTCELWYQTLLTEIEFIKKLMDDEDQLGESGELDDLDSQVCGQLLKRGSDGTVKKRWIFFDDNTASLFIFNSRAGLDRLNSGVPVEKELIDQIIPIQTIFAIEEMTTEMAISFHMKRDDAKFYFVIKAIKGETNIFLCPTIQVKRSWIDSLQILKEFYDTSDDTDNLLSEMNSSQSEDIRLGFTDASRSHKKPVAASLGITDIKEKPSKDVAVTDFARLKEGKDKAMYTIQGNKQVDVSQVEFSFSSLNHRNVYVIDCGTVVYQWNGKNASKLQKAKGLELSSTIKFKERGGAAELKVIDSESDMNDEMKKANAQFWKLFGGIENESKVPGDQAPAPSISSKPTLYRVSNIKDLAKAITTVGVPASGRPNKDILNTKYVYVLDTKDEVMVWIGKNAVPAQRNLAMVVAEKLLQQPDRKSWIKITQIAEGAETSLWKEKFTGYPGMLPIATQIVELRGNIATKKEQQDVDVKGILRTSIVELKEDDIPFSENTVFKSQKIKIWRVNKFSKEEYPEQLYGHFFAQDTFIVLFTWTQKGAPTVQHILFFWQGRETSNQSKGASAVLSVGIDDNMDGSAAQIRIEQNKEPVEFIMLFKGKFVVHKGSYTAQSNGSRLYDVRGTTANNAKAVEIESDFSRLNPLHCYVLLQPGNTNAFIWRGSRSINVEYEHAKKISAVMSKSVSEVKEGDEPEAFINTFATKNVRYIKPSSKPSLRHYSRLFLCTQSTGTFSCDEVRHVCQDELLNHNNCYILVPYSDQGCIFVWLGRSSDDFVKKGALFTAEDMLNSLSSEGFSKAFVAYDGKETNEFFFGIQGWNTTSGTARRRSSIMSSSTAKKENTLATLAEVMKIYCGGATYPYSVLLNEPLPEGVDPLKLESYLSEQDFSAVFDISKQEFYTHPVWKQQEMKKRVYLF